LDWSRADSDLYVAKKKKKRGIAVYNQLRHAHMWCLKSHLESAHEALENEKNVQGASESRLKKVSVEILF